MSISIEQVGEPDADVRALVGELEDELAAHYPPEQQHGLPLAAIFAPHVRFFVARAGGQALGCGGVALGDDLAEVKRMYVRPAARGRGVGEALLARIEATARAAGAVRLCLETGDRQAAALRFYARLGFEPCPAFGAYLALPPASLAASLFLAKHLHPAAPPLA